MGAVVLIISGEIFRTTFAHANMLVHGLLILMVILFFPRGIVGEFVRNMIRKCSILMVEHIMEAIIELSDHVLVLASGNLIAEGKPKEVIADERVIDAYLGTD